MRRHALRTGFIGVVAWYLSGCAITATVPAGEPVYEPPVVVVEPPAYQWHWWIWPHYDVEHHYVIEQEYVNIRDHHYYPLYEKAHPYVRNDQGKHKGWYKHRD